MLYSQTKERGNRFFIALRIAFPFFLLLFLWGYAFFKFEFLEGDDVILFTILSLIYVYFAFYMIYRGFETSFIDPVSKTFTREKISQIITSNLNKKGKVCILMGVKNLNAIISRYDFENTDKILCEFAFKFNDFLVRNGFKNAPIGKFLDGYFLTLVEARSDLNHILKNFENEINKSGLFGLEIRIHFSMENLLTHSNLKELLGALSFKLSTDQKSVAAYINKNEILNLLEYKKFVLKVQEIKSLSGMKSLYSLSVKLKFEKENISKSDFVQIINKTGLEIQYDLEILRVFLKSEFYKKSHAKTFVEISPVSLRNVYFLNEISKMVAKREIEPEKIIFEFWEEDVYEDLDTFKVILEDYLKMGFELAISHFGGKNAGFEYFKNLNLNYIIFDLEFSKNYANSKFETLLRALCAATANQNIKSIIKFIDSDEIFEKIKSSGVNFVQGFLIARPVAI